MVRKTINRKKERIKNLDDLERDLIEKSKNTFFNTDNIIKAHYPLFFIKNSPLASYLKTGIEILRKEYKLIEKRQ